MRLLSENPEISTRQIAEAVGISNGKAYYCVNALIEAGLVKLKNFSNSDKKVSYLYQLTPKGIRQKARLTSDFLDRKLLQRLFPLVRTKLYDTHFERIFL